MVKPFIAIIAKGKSGKSTIIKTLTGCGTSSCRDFVEDKSTGETILVICGSPQEQALSRSKLRELLQAAVADPKCRGVVIAIQPRRTRTRLSMETIFEEAADFDGLEVNTFIIDPERNGSAANVEGIRSRLGPFNAKIETLDGRRFALINAQIINDVTRVVSVGGAQETNKAAAAAGGKK